MKIRILILSFFLWSVSAYEWAPYAFAEATLNGQQQGSGQVNSPTVTTPPPAQTQKNAEEQTRDLNKKGQNQSNMLGMIAIAAGTAMIAAGMACSPSPCTGLIIAGTALVIAGMLALQAAAKMGNNASTAQGLGSNLSGISGSVTPQNIGAGNPAGTNPGIKIDPSLLRNEKAKSALGDLQKKTGIKPEDFIDGLNNGKTPAEMLGATGKFGSADKIQGLMDKYGAEAGPMSAQDLKDKLGVTDEDLKSDLTNDENAMNLAGSSSGGAKKSGDGSTDLASILGGAGGAGNGSDGSVGGLPPGKISAEVQAALDKNGITGRTVFDMVRSQYKKKTPMMFGVSQKQTGSSKSDNPFMNLNGSGIEL